MNKQVREIYHPHSEWMVWNENTSDFCLVFAYYGGIDYIKVPSFEKKIGGRMEEICSVKTLLH